MPYKCSVPKCRGNYDAENKVHLFSFPKNEDLRALWEKAIPNKRVAYSKNSRVCERHFHPDLIEHTTSAFDEKNGRLITAALERPRLKSTAVPHIFPGFPGYLSKPKSSRSSPSERRMKAEERSITLAVADSIASKVKYEDRHSFKSFEELLACSKEQTCSPFWTKVVNHENVMYLNIENVSGSIMLHYSVNIDRNLKLTVSLKGKAIKNICNVPEQVSHYNEISRVLDHIELKLKKPSDTSADALIEVIHELLATLKNVTKKFNRGLVFEFFAEQISLLNTSPERYRYSSNILQFANVLHLISPAAYKFVRQRLNIILPHPSTIQSICSKANVSPQNEINDV